MLLEISIEQFALIESLRLQFAGGLNVLTGETGAGKSIILDAVQAVLGGRTSTEVIRTGAERAVVEAAFDLSATPEARTAIAALGIPLDEEHLLLVRREISRSGRNAIRVNGRPATAGMLREAADGLVDLHGQHEHQSLLNTQKHMELLDQYGGSLLQREGKGLDLLDRYAGTPILALRDQVARATEELGAIGARLRELVGHERDRTRREDLLRFQVEELVAARLQPGEEEELETERSILTHAERLKLTAGGAYGCLYEGSARQPAVVDLLGRVKSDLEEVLRHDPSLQEALEMVVSALVNAQEAGHLLASYRERIDIDPNRLAVVERRLELIHALKRKYGESIAEMLELLEATRAELERLEHSEEQIADLLAQQKRVGKAAEELAERLTAARMQAGSELSGRVEHELSELGMADARFQVDVQSPAAPGYEALTSRGWDRVEFLFSPNAGEPVKPLARIISGGEMSRIMLALKAILARVDGVETLVFDEVDTGISGRAAQAVAEKLARIGADRQVLCVTHLPQVAAMADQHFLITKESAGGRTFTRVEALNEVERAEELARMIGGATVSGPTLEAARELLRRAGAHKGGQSPA